MDRKYILSAIKKTLDERLFWAIKKLYVQSKREKFEKIADFQNANSETRKLLLDEKYKLWYKSIDTFYLSFHSIFALVPLVKREKQIFEFDSQEMTVIKVDYKPYNGVEFSASHQTRFISDMTKEIEDCILELSDPKYEHIVDNYKPEKDTEKTPHEPSTNATLKYNCFYLFQFEYQYTTLLATLLYNADLITNPDTNGWNIDYDVVDEIITILNSKYKESQVLQRKRTFDTSSSVDRTQEAIRPIHYSKEYFPKNITKVKEFQNIEFENKREEEDTLKLYEFIFYITLSTQLKNSIYDTSSVDIVAGQHKLKQKAHKLIDGQDNWEILSGKYIKTIHENDNTEQGQSRVVVLPEFKSDDKIYPIRVYPYTYNSRRPRRYGIGRFAAQILEKDGIGIVSQQDDIILNLIESKSVIQIQKVLNPQEISIFFIDWVSQYAPLLINIEYMKEIDEKIQSVLDGEFSLESVIGEIDRLIDESFIKANYQEDISKPSIAKINLLNSIASKYNLELELEVDVYESNAKCDMILAMYPVSEPIKVGSCPECNSMVYQKEYIKKETGETLAYFACEKFNKSNGCTFSVWDGYVEKFFAQKGINLYTIEERKDALKKILSRKRGYLFSGLIDDSNKKFNAKIGISSFVPKKSEDKKIVWFLKVMKKEDVKKEDKKSDKLFANESKNIRRIQSITNEEKLAKQIKELEEKNKQLQENHYIDYLTGAYNRNSLDRDLETFWINNLGTQISIAFIDGDNFKTINDTYSHDGGDFVLKTMVERFITITQNLKTRVYKFGGDEFCIVFREPNDIVKATMESVRVYIEKNPIIYNQHSINISITAGVAFNIENLFWKELIKVADKMLYKAKAKGKNQITFNS